MSFDKKVVGGELRFVLVEKIGTVRLEKLKREAYIIGRE